LRLLSGPPDGPKRSRFGRFGLILVVVTVLFSAVASYLYCEDDCNLSKKHCRELLSSAREIARQHGYDIDEYELHIGQEDGFTTVTLEPKPLPDKNVVQVGGGGRLFFQVHKGKYTFIRIEYWQ